MMELILLFALSVIIAIVYHWGSPRFMASSLGSRFAGNYAMTVLGMALVIFVAVYVAAVVLGRAGKEPSLAALPGA